MTQWRCLVTDRRRLFPEAPDFEAGRQRLRVDVEDAGSRDRLDHDGRTRVIGGGELSEYAMGEDRQIRRAAFKGEQLFTSAILTVTAARKQAA